jgi:hypothetical protein
MRRDLGEQLVWMVRDIVRDEIQRSREQVKA